MSNDISEDYNYLRFNVGEVGDVGDERNVRNVRNVSNRLREDIKSLERIGVSNIYIKLKSDLKNRLDRDVNKPFIENLRLIKKLRGNDEYYEIIKKILKEILKQKVNTEKSLKEVKKYIDYMDIKNNKNGIPRLLLPGLENESKLGVILLPDLLSFTKTSFHEERYRDLLTLMARTFLGLKSDETMISSIKLLTNHLKNINQDDRKNLNINLEKYIK